MSIYHVFDPRRPDPREICTKTFLVNSSPKATAMDKGAPRVKMNTKSL